MKRVRLVSASLALWLLVLAACSGAGEPTGDTADSGEPKRLVVADSLFLPTIDPQGPVTEERAVYLFAEGLTAVNSESEITPSLAESWEVSDDGLDYTFALREGATFHNGDPVTAEDVKWSIERIMDPKTEARRYADMVDNIDSIKAVDESTVKITLKAPFAPFLGSLTDTFIISPESEMDESGAITLPIGTGPFEFVEWVPDERIELKKYEGYWEEGVPTVDEFEILNIPDEAARVSALRAGDIDAMFGFPAAQLEMAEDDPNIEVGFNTAARWWAFSFNLDSLSPPFDNPNVRKAIAMGIDKPEIVDLSTFGVGEVATDFNPQGQYWNLGVPDPYGQPDTEAAKELLASEGAAGTTVRILGTSAGGWDRPLVVLEEQLKSLGLETTSKISDWPAYEERLNESPDWDVSFMIIDYKLDPSRNFSFFDPKDSEAQFLGGGWQNEEYLDLISEARVTADPEQRKALYAQAYQMILDEVPAIIYANDRQIWGYRSTLTNFEPGLGRYHAPDSGFARATLSS